jgi:hypothetical protein
MSMNTRKNFLHRYRKRFTQRGGRKKSAAAKARRAAVVAARAPPPGAPPPRAPPPRTPPPRTPPPRAPPPRAPPPRTPPPTAPPPRTPPPRTPPPRTPNPASQTRKAKLTQEEKAAKAAADKKAGIEKGKKVAEERAAARKKKEEEDAAEASAAAKRKKDDADAAAAKKKKDDADAAAKKKKDDADAAAKKKKDDADAAAKKKKDDAKKKSGKRSMLPAMLSGLGSLASLAGKALLAALDTLKDMFKGLGNGLFGGQDSGGPGGPAGAADSYGSVSGNPNSSCSPAQQATKNEADAVRSKSLEAYPTKPNIILILEADKKWKETMDSAKPPIVGNCEPTAGSEDNSEKEATDVTVSNTVTDENFLEDWRKCEDIIEITPTITRNTRYPEIERAIDRALSRAKIDEDKSAIYAASRLILDPLNTRRYLNILKKQALEK